MHHHSLSDATLSTMFQFVFCFLALCYGANVATAASGCTIILSTDIPKNEPVILVSKNEGLFELFKPTGEVNTLPVGSVLHLSCLGTSNSIISTGGSEILLDCAGNNQWRDLGNGNTVKVADLGCKSIPSSSTQYSGESCLNGLGQILNSGFQVRDNFYPTFEICYDNVTEQAFYTHHKLNGASINNIIQESSVGTFSADGMSMTTTDADKCYLKSNQISRFNAIFGRKQEYIGRPTFLNTGHLASDADFIMSYEQLATYYYANSAPQFEAVDEGNWLSVEIQARQLASKVGRDLSSYNGYFGKLGLLDMRGRNRIEVNLDDAGKMPIPQYYFKVLHEEKTDAAIVFLTLNTPFEYSVQELCPNVCETAGLQFSIYRDLQRGYTYCCTLDDFRKINKNLPEELSASKLLTSSIA